MSVMVAMVDRGHSSQECQCARMLHRQNTRGRGGARSILKGEDLGDNWFWLENLAEKTSALIQLEGELNATLRFEHGGGQPASMLWVAHIHLSRLFCERLTLGWIVKAFAKHYHKEVMRSLVKIQDLVDLDEPPLGCLSASTSMVQR